MLGNGQGLLHTDTDQTPWPLSLAWQPERGPGQDWCGYSTVFRVTNPGNQIKPFDVGPQHTNNDGGDGDGDSWHAEGLPSATHPEHCIHVSPLNADRPSPAVWLYYHRPLCTWEEEAAK